MTFNTRRFIRVFALLTIAELCLLLCGCTSAWLTAVSGLLPSLGAIVNAIVAFVAALQGKTISPAFATAVQKWQQNISTEITAAENIIASLKQGTNTTLIGQFQAVMQSILSQFNSILTGADIADSSTVAKLTQFLGLGIAAINAVLAFIPMVVAKLNANAPKAELAHYDAVAASVTKMTLKGVKDTYVGIRSQHTDNVDVNAALDALPKSI
jgi:hypothetical protein